MKTKNPTLYRSLCGAVFAGAVLLMASGTMAQNLFVANASTDTIDEFTPGGVQSTFASGMNYPFGIAFNRAGDLFVANTADNAVPAAGNITEIAPNGTQSTFASGLDPIALAFNSAGDLFESDYRSGNIYEFTPGGMQSTFATGFSFPISLAFNSAGNLFVGSGYGNGNGIITRITPGGMQSTFATGLSFPQGLAFNSAGDLFAVDSSSASILEYTPGGVQSTFASVNNPQGLAFNSAGDMFVSTVSDGIIEITPGGSQSTFAADSGLLEELAFQPVPEPSVFALFGLGAAGMFILYRRMRTISI